MKPKGKSPAAVKTTAPLPPAGQPVWKKYMVVLLVLVPCIVYSLVMTLQFTGIDDKLFIQDNKEFNQNYANIPVSFQRGLFQPADKSLYDYYRPLFLVDVIVEYHLFGDNPVGYHLTNLFFHLLSVVLLYLLLKRLKLGETTSLILSLLFAVHPALSPAVVWIPGRNDMMLMVFLLAGLIFTIDYALRRRWQDFMLQLIFFLLALFTKETAVIIPLLAWFILVFVLKLPWKSWYPLIIGWFTAVGFWFFMESTVKQSGNRLPVKEMIESGIGRMPAFLQYLGKIFFPVNLSVYPQIGEMTVIWGVLAFGTIVVLLILSGNYFKPLTILGTVWFLLGLLPVLTVPKAFNDIVYEHRLYIPMIGVLLVLSQTVLFSVKVREQYRYILFGLIIVIFGAMSFIRTGYYETALAYWSRAVAESPGHAYSTSMLAKCVKNDVKQEQLFLQAYALDSTVKEINLNLGKIAYKNKHYDEAEKYLKQELALPSVKAPENFFLLAEVATKKQKYSEVKFFVTEGLKISEDKSGDASFLMAQAFFFENKFDSAAIFLRKVVAVNPKNEQANCNLVAVFLQLNQKDSAIARVKQMKQNGVRVPPELIKATAGEQLKIKN